MPSRTEVANLALAMVGDERVTSLEVDTSKPAKLCNELLPQVETECLVAHPWNFAIRRASLPALATAPPYEYDRQFQIPANCLRVLAVNSTDPHEPWLREGDAILTNLPAPLKIRYIARITDSGQWAPLFVSLVAATLAERLALPLAASQQSRAAIAQLIEDIRRRARNTDAAEGTPHPAYVPADVFVQARY